MDTRMKASPVEVRYWLGLEGRAKVEVASEVPTLVVPTFTHAPVELFQAEMVAVPVAEAFSSTVTLPERIEPEPKPEKTA